MADRQIGFKAPMIRALLAGRKTQTRRVIKAARVFATPECPAWTLRGDDLARALQGAARFRRAFEWQAPATRTGWLAHIGYAPGDHLWVREAWRSEAAYDDLSPAQMGGEEPIRYEADGHHQSWGYPAISRLGRFRAGMRMPRWASRITLVVTEVRVQRLSEISRDDAIAEGIERVGGGMLRWENWATGIEGMHGMSPQSAYALLWNAINGPGSWEASPWVAAYTFTVHLSNIDQVAG